MASILALADALLVMQWLGNLVGFLLAGVLGFFSTTSVYPLFFYALPKAFYWAVRGLFSWRLLLHLVFEGLTAATIFTILGLVGGGFLFVFLGLSEEAWGWGAMLGFASAIVTILTREGLAVVRMEFIRTALLHISQDNRSASLLLAEFKRRNPVDKKSRG